ncbi:MAG: long-chain fatty acid--CoA ligase [Idiomarina sp.]|nr:long-chain fatty acid--CoA ligase [Idiomarina sp.]
MAGNMMQTPLRVIDLLRFAAGQHGDKMIVSRTSDTGIIETTYAATMLRTAQLGHALQALGVEPGDCIASLAWNTHRHMELYYAVSGVGAILHTVNPRLFSEQIEYIINHAEDTYVFVDIDFIDLLLEVLPQLTTVKGVVVLGDSEHLPAAAKDIQGIEFIAYEPLLAGQPTVYDWPYLDDNQAAMLCYTSGTTGNPKGVLYSQRSIVLHAQATVSPALLDLREDSVLLPMVTMYHVGAWGAPYAAPLVGCTLVLPGNGTSGDAIWELIDRYQVNVALGVPTIWLSLHNYLLEQGIQSLPLKRVCVGGAASPLGLVKTYWETYGIYWQPIWGMTETGPLVTSAPPTDAIMQLPLEQRYQLQTTAGRAVFGIEMDIFDSNDQPLPHDGVTSGELRVRGPWICQQYFRHDDRHSFPNGWLATGDIAVIDAEGYMKVVDRKKDVIKSGGEWISSLDIENIVSQHPQVNECCVIGVRHPKWDERPLLLVHLKANATANEATKASIYQSMDGKIAKWWTPDEIVFVDSLPHTGTGKLTKNTLRDQYQDYLLTPATTSTTTGEHPMTKGQTS